MGTEKRERQKANRQTKLEEAAKKHAAVKRKKQTIRWGVILAVAVVAIVFISRQLVKDADKTAATTLPTALPTAAPTTTVAPIEPACPNANGSTPKSQNFTRAFDMCIDPTKKYTATVETTKGTYKAELDAVKAPLAVNNFVSLARYHYFDDTPCHRVIKGFMAQCGDPTGTGSGSNPGYTFKDELPASETDYKPGTLAMANSGKDTNGSQFFTMFRDKLAPSYTIFGQVTDGMDNTIKALDAVGNPGDGAPTEPVKILKVTITES